jgi:hypothetical protein
LEWDVGVMAKDDGRRGKVEEEEDVEDEHEAVE